MGERHIYCSIYTRHVRGLKLAAALQYVLSADTCRTEQWVVRCSVATEQAAAVALAQRAQGVVGVSLGSLRPLQVALLPLVTAWVALRASPMRGVAHPQSQAILPPFPQDF